LPITTRMKDATYTENTGTHVPGQKRHQSTRPLHKGLRAAASAEETTSSSLPASRVRPSHVSPQWALPGGTRAPTRLDPTYLLKYLCYSRPRSRRRCCAQKANGDKEMRSKMLSVLCVVTALTAGSVKAQVETCEQAGVFTIEGECQGAEAVFCPNPSAPSTTNVARYNCADPLGDGSGSGGCTVIADWGSWCIFDAGSRCAYPSGAMIQYFGCGSVDGDIGTLDPTDACDIEQGCVDDVGTCTPPSPGATYVATCVDDSRLSVACRAWGQHMILTCTSPTYGATGCSGGRCRGVPVGGECGGYFRCADGLQCSQPNPQQPGTCEPAPIDGGDSDSGFAEVDAGGDIDAGDSGQPTTDEGCQNTVVKAKGLGGEALPLAIFFALILRRPTRKSEPDARF
jgi:hypothetical protein